MLQASYKPDFSPPSLTKTKTTISTKKHKKNKNKNKNDESANTHQKHKTAKVVFVGSLNLCWKKKQNEKVWAKNKVVV